VLKKCRPHGLPDRNARNCSACAPRCHGRGHRPCHSATLNLGPPGAQSPRPAPAPPSAGASRPPGRALASVGAGGDGLCGSVPRGRGKRSAFPVPARSGGFPDHAGMPGPSGGGHRPCHITTLILGPPGAKAPGQRPPRPRRELFARRVGRWPAVGAGGTGPGGSVARRRGKRHAFPVSAQRGNPFPRIGKIFPAVRRSDCFFSALPTRSAQNAVMGSKARRPGATPKPALCGGLFPSWLRGDHAAAGTSPYTRQGPSPQG
jgi:hypothetical protein